MVLANLFSIISVALNIYTIVCFAAIVVSWIPGLKFTAFGKFIYAITEPYMGFFSKKGWFRFGRLDFSPILSIGLLSILTTLFANLAGAIASGIPLSRSFAVVTLNSLITGPFQIASSLLGFLWLLLLIRWIILLATHGTTSYNSAWNSFDDMISRLTYKISQIFTKKPISYKTSLLISWITVLVTIGLLSIAVYYLKFFAAFYVAPVLS